MKWNNFKNPWGGLFYAMKGLGQKRNFVGGVSVSLRKMIA